MRALGENLRVYSQKLYLIFIKATGNYAECGINLYNGEELIKKINRLKEILANERLLLNVIKEEKEQVLLSQETLNSIKNFPWKTEFQKF